MEKRLRRIIRKHELPQYLGYKRSHLDKLLKEKKLELPLFPLTEGGRAVGAWEDDVIALQLALDAQTKPAA